MHNSSDILGSTQNLSKPHFPVLKAAQNLPPLNIEESLRLPWRKLGTAFESLISIGINERASDVLQDMANLAIVIDGHCRGARPIADMGMFIYRRNALQHRLMSLSTGDELNAGEVGYPNFYEAIRLAMVIFSAAVTFPLPPLSGIFPKLARNLVGVLEMSELESYKQRYPKSILWVLIMGGISAIGTEDRPWYIDSLREVARELGFWEWDDIAREMEAFLWLSSACDSGGSSLWAEVKAIAPSKSME